MHHVMSSSRHDHETWQVKLPSGETRTLSLDELDAAFQAGWVDERTLVLRAGERFWAPLGEIAGLDATPPPVEATPNSITPLAFDASPPSAYLGPDLGTDEHEARAMRPRTHRKVLGVMTALVVIAGVGYAGLKAKPLASRALATSSVTARAAAVAPPADVHPAAPPSPAASPSPAHEAAPAVPTVLASSLPDAPPLVSAAGRGKKPGLKVRPSRAPKRSSK